MSMRGSKRALGTRGDEPGVSKRSLGARGEEPSVSKRRKTEQDELWQLRPVSDLKMSSIYNRSASEAPAELFRKDLISAMKLPDSEPLTTQEYWIITDTWKQEWERGVQVPVNPDSLPAPAVQEIPNPLPPNFQEFKLPKNKYIHLTRDAHYQYEIHQLSPAVARAEAACTYDLDATDSAWLKILNGERARAGSQHITEDQLEKVLQELEVRCWDKIQAIMKSEEGLGIEYDENVICDVCRSPDSEEGNEMVFCDACNICVHQACYGITTIPSGQWLCRPCGDGVRPTCVLCPNLGGAMKCTPSGHKWAHVSCVLWIPEVSIGCAEKMEPITKISGIPPSRWSLLCILCRERKGACIQCSVKTCKTAYHVTCAFKHGLEMRAIIEDENADDGVKLRSYCQKHSVNSKKEKSAGSGSECEDEFKRKRRKDMTSEEKSQARAQRLHEIEAEFDKHVSIKDISSHLLDVDQDAITYIYNYWKLKRRSGHNRPLLPPKSDDTDILSHRQEQADLDKMKMFVQLRQDLERVRNLCYMVSRREKLSRTFIRMREQTFHKQIAVLSEEVNLSGATVSAVAEANHGPSIYDRLYSHPEAPDHSDEFDTLMARITGSEDSKDQKKDINGLVKSKKSANPYKKLYLNGSSRRSGSIYSEMSSEESASDVYRVSKYRRAIGSSTEEDMKPSVSPKKKVTPPSKDKPPLKVERKKRTPPSRFIVDSSSEDEGKSRVKKEKAPQHSKTLRALEREMSPRQSGTDSGEFIPFRNSRNVKFPVDIYSDSSEASNYPKIEDFSTERSPNTTNDSQQQLPRTKAAMKEFIPIQKSEKGDARANKRGRKPSCSKAKLLFSDDEAKNKENIKLSKSKDYPSDLIVPQRQAAKKASEIMRSTTKVKDAELTGDSNPPSTPEEIKLKPRAKAKVKEKEMPYKDTYSRKKLSSESLDLDKDDKDSLEPIAYVPQRQAAKKAAAHIKSGLGSKLNSNTDSNEDSVKNKVFEDKTDVSKKSPKREEDKQSKSSSRSSSSSSSNSSSSSYSSSSSSEEEDGSSNKSAPPRQPSLFSPAAPRPSVDLPFLDKVSRPLSSSSASSDSDSVKESLQSASRSPSPKRVRPRRKDSAVSDVCPRKAPDKKLKTSERASECRVPSPTAEGEERGGAAAPRSRARSIATSGNLSYKRDAGPRKPTRDDTSYPDAQNKPAQKTGKPSELPATQRKEDETLSRGSTPEYNKHERTHPCHRTPKIHVDDIFEDEMAKRRANKSHKISESSSRSSVSHRRASVREIVIPTNECSDLTLKEVRCDKSDYSKSPYSKHKSVSPNKSLSPTKKQHKSDEHSPRKDAQVLSKSESHKSWFPGLSPDHQPPPVEKFRDTDKYLTEDKSIDSDSADKSSLKVIAKIQANLNDNVMIQSPKTPMDATTHIIEPLDLEPPNVDQNMRKRSTSTLEIDKKFHINAMQAQDSNTTHGVESFKINEPYNKKTSSATGNTIAKRSIFSPQPTPKDTTDLFEFGNNILAVDDSVSEGFGNEEIMKPFSFTSEFLFKEDSKEDRGVQETLNLVEKLRMTLSSKKPTIENTDQEILGSHVEKQSLSELEEANKEISEDKASENQPSPLESTDADKSQPSIVSVAPSSDSTEDIQQGVCVAEQLRTITPEAAPINSTDKWQDTHMLEQHSHIEDHHSTKYDAKQYEMKHYDMKPYEVKHYDDHSQFRIDHHMQRHEMMKHSIAMPHELQASEHDNFRDNISKQSDDSRSIVEQSINSNDQDTMMHGSIRSQSYENNNSLPQSDCATTSSPYREREGKWCESKITQRRSSASSTNSENSACSQQQSTAMHLPQEIHQAGILRGMDYPSMPPYPMEPMSYSAFSSEASPFVTHASVSLFQPGPCTSASLSMQSPGAGLYPPILTVPYSSTSILPPLSKPFTTMCAAFTTSSQNMALTTAMIAPATPKPSPRDDMDLSTEKSFSVQASPTPSVDSFNDTSSGRGIISKISNESNDTVSTQSTLESKSSTKPTRASNRFIGQPNKSPAKSPGFSPKRSESVKSNASKRSSSSKGSRGRGRGRSKTRGGQPTTHGYLTGNVDFLGNSLTKLVGTVYELDFDEETANDGVDLKAMRERRRSVDVHDRKSEHSFKDSSQSPHLSSPHQQNNKNRPQVVPSTEPKESRPPSRASEMQHSAEASPHSRTSSERTQFPAIVQPVLPGPVDMRRYRPIDTPAPAREPFNRHLLGTFDGVTPHQPLVEIDDDIEKDLHMAPMSSNPPSPNKSPVPEIIEPPTPYIPEVPLPKVSLSDSRNQLKVKIKGPFRDANYSTSTLPPVVQQPVVPVYEPPPGILGTPSAVASVTSAMLTGTSNLRRMRKKELLRQYWTQDMNMDEPAVNTSMGSVPPPVHQSPLSRTIITIPKAVASMTTIPTREDYKAVVDANMEKKRRKATGGSVRELRNLDLPMNDDLDTSDEINLPSFSGTLTQAASRKGRGRLSVKPGRTVPPSPVAPKLKIKIGPSAVQPVTEEPSSSFQFRPPKKRLTSIPKPTLEDLRRESMKYRRKVMADFDEGKKEKKHKPKSEKSEKRKKKKEKKAEKLQVVNAESDSTTKLIIKITRKKGETAGGGERLLNPPQPPPPPPSVDPFEYDPSAPDPLAIDPPSAGEVAGMRKVRTSKVTPIRLKLARSSEGSAYVMKDSQGEGASAGKRPPQQHSDVR